MATHLAQRCAVDVGGYGLPIDAGQGGKSDSGAGELPLMCSHCKFGPVVECSDVRARRYRSGMGELRLAELDGDNLGAVIQIPPAVGAKAYVAPVVYSIAEAYVTPTA